MAQMRSASICVICGFSASASFPSRCPSCPVVIPSPTRDLALPPEGKPRSAATPAFVPPTCYLQPTTYRLPARPLAGQHSGILDAPSGRLRPEESRPIQGCQGAGCADRAREATRRSPCLKDNPQPSRRRLRYLLEMPFIIKRQFTRSSEPRSAVRPAAKVIVQSCDYLGGIER
jgi:hypothetical protein